jgi:bacteriorhodopsin
MNIVRTSAIASLVAQLLIGAVTSVGFFVDVTNAQYREDLHTILAFEVSSQIIEFLWYAFVIVRSQTITARFRYVDWVLSTPVMLISLAMFFRHRDSTSPSSSVLSIFESYEIYACLAVNWIMLAFGFAMESAWIPDVAGLIGGGLFLVGSFTFLAVLTPIDTMSHVLFWVTFSVWGLYGVAAAFNDVTKNVMYNTIDVVSKNCFGLFLFVYALTLQTSASNVASTYEGGSGSGELS